MKSTADANTDSISRQRMLEELATLAGLFGAVDEDPPSSPTHHSAPPVPESPPLPRRWRAQCAMALLSAAAALAFCLLRRARNTA